MTKLILEYDYEAGYYLSEPKHGSGGVPIELSDAEYADWLRLQENVKAWQKRLEAMWTAPR